MFFFRNEKQSTKDTTVKTHFCHYTIFFRENKKRNNLQIFPREEKSYCVYALIKDQRTTLLK
jgi:hypothetical protein